MRVLLSCVPGYGHFYPLVPVALALRDAGHEVGFATAERFCRNVVEPAGFAAFPAGLSPLDAQDRLAEREPQLFDGGDDEAAQAAFGAALFARVAGPAKVGDLATVIRDWAPALVVHDAVDFGAPAAATAAGLPHAAHGTGPLPPVEFWRLAAGESGLDPGGWPGLLGQLYLDICPPSLQAAHIGRVAAARPLRPVGFDLTGADRLPAWVGELPARPTVYVTLGTVFNTTPGLFETILAGLAGEPVTVVATVGPDRDPAELGPQPGNVHLERYLPQSLLLAHCDAVVAHGGSGTTLAALAHGLPLLMLPQGADQLGTARRVAELGAGTTLDATEVAPGTVRAAVHRLLSEAAYRERARKLAAEIARMPGPRRAVELLTDLTQRGATAGSSPPPAPPRAG